MNIHFQQVYCFTRRELNKRGEDMSKKLYFYIVAIILGLNYNALANISESDKEIFKKHAELSKAQDQINFESTKILSNYKSLLGKYVSSFKALKSGKLSAIDRSVKNLKRQKKYSENSLKSGKRNLQQLQKKIDSIKINKAKQVEIDALCSAENKLKLEMNKLHQPYNQRRINYISKIDIDAERPKLKALITPLVKEVPGLISKVKLHIFYDSFNISCQLYNNNKSIGWMNISVRPIKNTHQKEKLAGKYAIYNIFRNNMHFKVKDFQVAFQINNKFIQNKEQLKELAPKLIDLPGLEKASAQQAVQKWLAASKFIQKLNEQSAAATGTLNSQRAKLNSKIYKLSRKGFKSSAEIKRLNAAYLHAKSSYKSNKDTIAVADFLLKHLKSPANNRKSAILAIEKKIADLKNEIFNYCVTVKKQKVLLAKDINFLKANKQYQILVRKFVRLPQSENFALVNRKVVDAWLGNPQIKCRWEQDFSTGLNPSIYTIFTGKISYRPDYILSHNKGMIDNKYPIIDNNYNLTVRVGDFNVNIYSAANNFYDRDIHIKAIKEFYDLDAIANITK